MASDVSSVLSFPWIVSDILRTFQETQPPLPLSGDFKIYFFFIKLIFIAGQLRNVILNDFDCFFETTFESLQSRIKIKETIKKFDFEKKL